MQPPQADITAAIEFATLFDAARHCGWNNRNGACRPDRSFAPGFTATDIPEFKSMGSQCHAPLYTLAMLHTLRPCKDCGSDHLYFSDYQVTCCDCFGDEEEHLEQEEKDDGCHHCAENANLPDAITAWNLNYGDDGEPGRVFILGHY